MVIKLVAVSLMAVLAMARPAAGQINLVPNPGFDTNLSGWNLPDPDEWSVVDATGDLNSGSAYLAPTGPAGDIEVILACFLVMPNTEYDFGGLVEVIHDPETAGGVSILIQFYTDTDCVDFTSGGGAVSGVRDVLDAAGGSADFGVGRAKRFHAPPDHEDDGARRLAGDRSIRRRLRHCARSRRTLPGGWRSAWRRRCAGAAGASAPEAPLPRSRVVALREEADDSVHHAAIGGSRLAASHGLRSYGSTNWLSASVSKAPSVGENV